MLDVNDLLDLIEEEGDKDFADIYRELGEEA